MAKTLIVSLTDDLTGGEAAETVYFSIDGKSYEIDLNDKNAAGLRKAFEMYVSHGRVVQSSSRRSKGTSASSGTGAKTLFSQLDSEEKDRFRLWANLPTARRIADARVQEWIDAGKP